MSNELKIGDLVEYEIRTEEGPNFRAGLLISMISAIEADVWNVLGLDGEDYRIHSDYLKTFEQGNKNET